MQRELLRRGAEFGVAEVVEVGCHDNLIHFWVGQFAGADRAVDAQPLVNERDHSLVILNGVGWIHALPVGTHSGETGFGECPEVDAVVPIGTEILDISLRNLLTDPLEQESVVRVAEVGEVRHDAEVVHLGIVEILWRQDFGNVEMLLGQVQTQLAVLETAMLVEG